MIRDFRIARLNIIIIRTDPPPLVLRRRVDPRIGRVDGDIGRLGGHVDLYPMIREREQNEFRGNIPDDL